MTRLIRTCAALALTVSAALAASPALADEPRDTLAKAAQAWDEGLLTDALPLYEQALREGGLFPADVVVAYVRIGTVHAATGKKDAAIGAFKVAAMLDPDFELPADSGPAAKKLFDQARQQAKKQGGKLAIAVEAPEQATEGKPFSVTATLPEAFAPVVDKVGVEVKDTLAKAPAFKADHAAMASVTFDVPGSHVKGPATLLVRTSALDQHGNRWAMAEANVKVPGLEKTEVVPPPPAEPDDKAKSGFWASPWPYVIGGALVVGGVGAYLLTRPSDEVSVGAPAWR